MVAIPLYVFLFIFLFSLLFFIIFIAINISHLFHTGMLTLASFVVTFIFLAATALVLWTSWYYLQTIDWQQTVPLWNKAWLPSLTGLRPFPN